MRKRFLLMLAALLLTVPFALGEDAEDMPWVTVDTLREQADYVWNTGNESLPYSTKKDLFPIALHPEEAYAALAQAYEAQGEAGTAAYLQSLGIEGYSPSGQPVMHDVLEANGPIRVVAFSGWGWGEEGSLLFKEKDSVWYLEDFVDEECLGIRRCGNEGPFFLEFSLISHGTGCYAKYIDLYNLSTMKIEAGYTSYGHEMYGDCVISCYGAACWTRDGLHIFRKLCGLQYDETAGNIGNYENIGSVLDVFDYAPDEDGSLAPVPTDGNAITYVYYNSLGGKYYHAVPNCRAINERYWPLSAVPLEKLNSEKYINLVRCPVCNPPERPGLDAEEGVKKEN